MPHDIVTLVFPIDILAPTIVFNLVYDFSWRIIVLKHPRTNTARNPFARRNIFVYEIIY